MSAMTDYMENKLIDWFFRGQVFLPPTILYIGLFNVAPSDTRSGTEVSTAGTNYARVAYASGLTSWAGTQSAGSTTVSTGTSGTTSNTNTILFGLPAETDWGAIVAVGVFDAPTSGHLLWYSALSAEKRVIGGDRAPTFIADSLSFQIDN